MKRLDVAGGSRSGHRAAPYTPEEGAASFRGLTADEAVAYVMGHSELKSTSKYHAHTMHGAESRQQPQLIRRQESMKEKARPPALNQHHTISKDEMERATAALRRDRALREAKVIAEREKVERHVDAQAALAKERRLLAGLGDAKRAAKLSIRMRPGSARNLLSGSNDRLSGDERDGASPRLSRHAAGKSGAGGLAETLGASPPSRRRLQASRSRLLRNASRRGAKAFSGSDDTGHAAEPHQRGGGDGASQRRPHRLQFARSNTSKQLSLGRMPPSSRAAGASRRPMSGRRGSLTARAGHPGALHDSSDDVEIGDDLVGMVEDEIARRAASTLVQNLVTAGIPLALHMATQVATVATAAPASRGARPSSALRRTLVSETPTERHGRRRRSAAQEGGDAAVDAAAHNDSASSASEAVRGAGHLGPRTVERSPSGRALLSRPDATDTPRTRSVHAVDSFRASPRVERTGRLRAVGLSVISARRMARAVAARSADATAGGSSSVGSRPSSAGGLSGAETAPAQSSPLRPVRKKGARSIGTGGKAVPEMPSPEATAAMARHRDLLAPGQSKLMQPAEIVTADMREEAERRAMAAQSLADGIMTTSPTEWRYLRAWLGLYPDGYEPGEDPSSAPPKWNPRTARPGSSLPPMEIVACMLLEGACSWQCPQQACRVLAYALARTEKQHGAVARASTADAISTTGVLSALLDLYDGRGPYSFLRRHPYKAIFDRSKDLKHHYHSKHGGDVPDLGWFFRVPPEETPEEAEVSAIYSDEVQLARESRDLSGVVLRELIQSYPADGVADSLEQEGLLHTFMEWLGNTDSSEGQQGLATSALLLVASSTIRRAVVAALLQLDDDFNVPPRTDREAALAKRAAARLAKLHASNSMLDGVEGVQAVRTTGGVGDSDDESTGGAAGGGDADADDNAEWLEESPEARDESMGVDPVQSRGLFPAELIQRMKPFFDTLPPRTDINEELARMEAAGIVAHRLDQWWLRWGRRRSVRLTESTRLRARERSREREEAARRMQEAQRAARRADEVTASGKPVLRPYRCNYGQCVSRSAAAHAFAREARARGNERAGQLHRCGRCMAVAYCDAACQAADWDDHRSVCKKWEPRR